MDAKKCFVGGLERGTSVGQWLLLFTVYFCFEESDIEPTGRSGVKNCIFVESLREHFKQFGLVEDVVIPKSPEDGLARGFAFITYHDPNEAASAMEAAPETHILNGRQVSALLF